MLFRISARSTLIRTLDLSVEGAFVDYRLPPPHLGNSNKFDCSRFVVGSEPPKKRRFIKRLANLAHLQIYHYLCGGKITALK